MEELAPLGLLSLENITYRQKNVSLINDMNFTLYPGEIHTLMYSDSQECTLLKRILSGEIAYKHYFGNIYWNSKPVLFNSPLVPLRLGLALADSQSLMIKEFNIQENIFLGIEENEGDFFLDKEKEEKETWNWLKLFHLPFSPQTLLEDLDPDIYYLLCVLRALNRARKLLVLQQDLVEALCPKFQEILRHYLLKQIHQGLSILYLCVNPRYLSKHSHKTSQLERGVITLKWLKKQQEETFDSFFQTNWVLPCLQRGEEYEDALISFLGWEGESKPGAKPQKIDFHCYRGKLQGLGGLAYHNRQALRSIFSGLAKPKEEHTLLWRGKPLQFETPREALESRLGVVSCEQQLIKEFTIKDNLLLKAENLRIRLLLDKDFYVEKFKSIFKGYHIELPPWDMYVGDLNALEVQLLLLAQTLILEPLFIFLEDPTCRLTPNDRELYFEILNLICKNNISLLVLCSTSWDFSCLPCHKLWIEEGHSIEDLLRGD